MDLPIINATVRTIIGKEQARKVRKSERVPATCYGPGIDPISVACDPKPIKKAIMSARGVNTVLALQVEGESEARKVLIKDFQLHPVKRRLLHCDLYQVDDAREVVLAVPVEVVGRSAGEKIGGRVHKVLRTLKVRSRVDHIPGSIQADVTGLNIGSMVKISQLAIPDGCEILYRVDQPVIMIKAARGADEVAATTEDGEGEGEDSAES